MLKKTLFAFWLGLLAAAGWYFFTHDITIETIQQTVAGFGWWAALIYIAAYTLRPLVFFPTSIMTPASVLLFGDPLVAWLVTYIGENFSANLAFFVARYFGRNFVAAHENAMLKKFDRQLTENGFATLLFLRLVPLFPFDFVNYLSGLSGIRHRDYLLGTALGVIPGLTAYILAGASIFSNPWYLVPTIMAFLLLILLGRKLHAKYSHS